MRVVERLLQEVPVKGIVSLLRRIVSADACCTDIECIVVPYP